MANNNEAILSTLADMNEAIGARFDRVDERFAEVDRRFDKVDQRFNSVDQELAHILERLNRIEDHILQEHARRLEALERKVGLSG